MKHAVLSQDVGTPFPLKRYYLRRMVPTILVILIVMGAVLWFAFGKVTRHIYLEQAQSRADLIVEILKDTQPDAWNSLLGGKSTPQDVEAISTLMKEEVERQKLISLKAYDLRGTVLYDLDPNLIGTIETAQSLREVIVSEQPTLLRKTAANGALAYEIYIPILDPDGNLRTIFEMYEEVSFLDTLLLETAVPAIGVPVVLQLVLVLLIGILVGRAQRDIDRRTDAIGQLSARLETFVSASALDAARNARTLDDIPSRKLTCTLFHSDVRDFTSYAEDNSPERVVFFLNDLMNIQIKVIDYFGGDVDKMIGDALLARFEGPDAEKRAIDAAKAILDAVRRASLARGLGIGIYTGPVISGAVGPKSRRDFTVIGDSVNMSARLCSHAQPGELVVDDATVAAAGAKGFGAPEAVQVKGHAETVAARHWHIDSLPKKKTATLDEA